MRHSKVLHITPHCGGGVGDTLFGLISGDKEFIHEIVVLGYALDRALDRASFYSVHLYLDLTHKEILEMIPDYDIILIHAWNHPLLYDFLVRNKLPKCRLIMWGHNSGFHPPNIYPEKILTYPDLFVFTTPLSYQTIDVIKLKHKDHLDHAWSTAGIKGWDKLEKREHEGFNVGYIGTVDYAKLHPAFLKMCADVDIPDVKFIVVGGSHEKEIEAEAKDMGISDRFEFVGRVPYGKLRDYLQIFDVFGYPLAPYHYGTCDLVLQMAMASGIPPVVLNNPMERFMLTNGESGMVVSPEQYSESIKILYNSPELRKWFGSNARKEAIERYSLNKLVSKWNKLFNKVLNRQKTEKEWDINKKEISYADVFLESLGHYGKDFEKNIRELAKIPSWQTETKGSVHNYSSYFKNDITLRYWSDIMKSELK